MIVDSNRLSSGKFIVFLKNIITLVFVVGMGALLITGCDSSTSANGEEEEKNSNKNPRTFDLVLSSDNSTNIGTITTSEITEDDDAYIDEGFFVTIELSDTDFSPPFDINMTEVSGQCGTWDVEPDEKAEMPCDYEYFLSNPGNLVVTSEDGDGEDAYPE